MRFAFIAEEKVAFPVRLLCRTLHVSRAGSTPGKRARRPPGRGRTPGWGSRSRRSMPRAGSGMAARAFTPSSLTVAPAPVVSGSPG